MKKNVFLLCIVLALTVPALAQRIVVNGKVADTLEKKAVQHAVVAILDKKDSTLLSFTRTHSSGEFSLEIENRESVILLITSPGFADFTDQVKIKSPSLELGTIALTQKAQLLEEVVVRGVQAIRIKGDTTEYLADSFTVRDGATVEELLKVLPGFQVDAKGNITAHGQKVQKVLVDGEEFFGDDPTMATQNIGAKAVDKVQVFDSKSEQQKLTGINNGSDGKTINIQLKADKKKGAFGKIYAGTDFDKYDDAKALYNNFVGKRKISVYGTKSKVNTGSLDGNEKGKLGIEDDYEYDEITGIFNSNTDNEFDQGNNRGLPDSYTAGALYINKWNQDKHGINGSYRYNRLETNNIATTLTQNILADSITYTNNNEKSEALMQQHALNGKYEWKPDSLTSFRIISAGKYKFGNSYKTSKSEYLNDDGLFINQNERTNTFNSTKRDLDNQLMYSQLFKKKKRQLIATVRFGLTDNDQDGFLYARTKFFENGEINNDTLTDQQKNINNYSRSLGTKITYSEPITNKLSIVGSYSFNTTSSLSNYNTFNKSDDGKYNFRDSLFSNNFDMNAVSHSGTAILRYDTKKVRISAGSGISDISFKLLNLAKNTVNNYKFLNHTPVVFFNYAPKQYSSFTFRYNGNTTQPAIDQLQPLRNNNDPLNIFVGNPDLKVGFRHKYTLGYMSYKVLKSQYIYSEFNYMVNRNAVVFENSINEKGLRIYRPINVNGNNNWYGNIYYGIGQGDRKLSHFAHFSASGGNNVAFINNNRSNNRFLNTSAGYSLSYDIRDKFGLRIEPKIGYNKSRSSIQALVKNNYFTYGGNGNLFIMLPLKLEFNTNINVDLRQKIAAFERNNNIVIWNTELGRKVFKDKSGKIILQGFDILNQNRGYTRNINSNFVSDEYYSQINRYFMLKFEWSFNKMPGLSK